MQVTNFSHFLSLIELINKPGNFDSSLLNNDKALKILIPNDEDSSLEIFFDFCSCLIVYFDELTIYKSQGLTFGFNFWNYIFQLLFKTPGLYFSSSQHMNIGCNASYLANPRGFFD